MSLFISRCLQCRGSDVFNLIVGPLQLWTETVLEASFALKNQLFYLAKKNNGLTYCETKKNGKFAALILIVKNKQQI